MWPNDEIETSRYILFVILVIFETKIVLFEAIDTFYVILIYIV